MNMLLLSCDRKPVNPSTKFQKMYKSDFFSFDHLVFQLTMLPEDSK